MTQYNFQVQVISLAFHEHIVLLTQVEPKPGFVKRYLGHTGESYFTGFAKNVIDLSIKPATS